MYLKFKTYYTVKSGTGSGAGFALQIRRNPPPARFPKSKSGTALPLPLTLVHWLDNLIADSLLPDIVRWLSVILIVRCIVKCDRFAGRYILFAGLLRVSAAIRDQRYSPPFTSMTSFAYLPVPV